MTDNLTLLGSLAIFSSLTREELKAVQEIASPQKAEAGKTIFDEGDQGTTLFIVVEGAVEIVTRIGEDVEKTLIVVRPGSVFGELSLIDEGDRSAMARAVESSQLLVIERAAFQGLVGKHPVLGNKILNRLTAILCDRLRTTTEQYRRNVEWGLSVSGAVALNFHRLIVDKVELYIELNGGKKLEGVLLKVEKSGAGHELLVRTKDGRIQVVPYHAVLTLSFDKPKDA